ncbi:hypothetical protein AN958_12889, partial [Leucoagaricus sp. SymC.cos]
LPKSMHTVHSVFYVSMLEPSTPNPFPNHSDPPPAPVVIDSEPEFDIAHIVNSKLDHQCTCHLLYKVFWLGYEDTEDESSWLPATELKHVAELVTDFHSTYPGKPGSVEIFNSYVS